MNVCEAYPFFAFHSCWWIRRMSHWREIVYPLRRICVKRGRVFEDDVFIENTCLGSGSKRRTKFTRGRSFTQVMWFSWPMCASAIFVVGTSGRPPKLNYRSVKSYNTKWSIWTTDTGSFTPKNKTILWNISNRDLIIFRFLLWTLCFKERIYKHVYLIVVF